MAKWKCEVCGNEFENFHAQGFDNKIYCPLCYFKKENQELKKQLEEKESIACNWKDSCLENAGKIEILENQQREFIEYLENEIDRLEKTEFYIDSIQKAAIETHKHDLSKYKEIIGGKDE